MEAKKIINSLQKRGLKGSIQRFRQGPQKVGLVDFWSFITDREVIEFNFEDFKKHKEGNQITLNWIIPEMGEGSGGHLNIFRFVSYLERHGIHNRMYLYRSTRFLNDTYLKAHSQTDGVKSYGRMVDLMLVYYRSFSETSYR